MMTQRYDPGVLVVIEYVHPDREKEQRPIIWDIEGVKYGFWRNPRKTKGLEAWQERVPASAGLPRVDNIPRFWKLIHDPREAYAVQPEDVAPPSIAPPVAPTAAPEPIPAPVPIVTEMDAAAPEILEPIEAEGLETEELGEFEVPELPDDDEQEYILLCDEILIQRGPRTGQVKKSATPEQVARWTELRERFNS